MKKKLLLTIFTFLLLILLSKSIFAITIVIDPGHGGKDTGAINTKLGLYERNQVWKIANYMQEYLKEYYDTNVYLTCPTFETTGEAIPREERADIMKAHNADLAISIHIDSSTSSKMTGATAYITNLPKFNSDMTRLSNELLTNLTKLGITSNGIKTRKTESNDGYYNDGTPLDYYGIIRYPTLHDIPIVLLEHCYISNNDDCKFIDSDEDLKKIAKADSNAIVKYLNLKLPSEIIPTLKIKEAPKYALVGKEQNIEIELSPSSEKEKTLLWESDDETIIKVSKDGKISPLKEGTAKIKVTWKEKNISDEVEINSISLPEDTKIEIKNYLKNECKISKIGPNVKLEDFMKNIIVSDNLRFTVLPQNTEQKTVGTNTKLTILEKEHDYKIEEYDCIVYGDVNGDGEIDAVDYTLIKNDIMDLKKITDSNMKLAADVNGDGEMDAVDYTLIKNDIMELKKLTLR